mgnify:CR=1 FL=1
MNISKYFQHRFTLSEDGAKTFIKGVIASLFLNLALMLPVIFTTFDNHMKLHYSQPGTARRTGSGTTC